MYIHLFVHLTENKFVFSEDIQFGLDDYAHVDLFRGDESLDEHFVFRFYSSKNELTSLQLRFNEIYLELFPEMFL